MTIHCSPIKLGPVLASPPYTEGEFYSVENRNDSAIEVLIWSHFAKKTLRKKTLQKTLDNRNIAQCQIENAPAASLVILTFNSSYMENMKTLVTTRRFSHHWHCHCHCHCHCHAYSVFNAELIILHFTSKVRRLIFGSTKKSLNPKVKQNKRPTTWHVHHPCLQCIHLEPGKSVTDSNSNLIFYSHS